ncbi:MAG TPA: septum formation family protein [Actinotalea sp.]|nr:septum formation family protein [Actinotalea sp.]
MGRERRKVALLVIGGVVAVVVVVGVVAAARYWLASRPLGEVTRAQTVAAGRLATGHCLGDLPRDGAVGSVRVVPCAEPHTAEVVGELPLSGTSWPGAERVQDQAAAWCEMDASQAELDLRAVVWTPTEASWAQGDRTALCLAWNPSGTMTGSFTSGDPVTTG